jgi:hypothetical protein
MSMKARIAALALAVAFLAGPALAAIGGSCPPCSAQPGDSGPCSSLAAVSCCDDVTTSTPVKTTPDTSTVHLVAGFGSAAPFTAAAHAPHTALELTAPSPQRLSVVRRL